VCLPILFIKHKGKGSGMIITEALIQRIRVLLNEAIPEGGSEADTHFSN